MKFIFLFLSLIGLFQISNSQDFITHWTFPDSTTHIQFSALTIDTVYYTWIASPSGNSGNGSFIQTMPNTVLLSGLDIQGGDTVTLNMVSDNLSRFYFERRQGQTSLIDVSQWGDVSWTSMNKAFLGCERLNISASDTPNLTNVTSMDLMFFDTHFFNDKLIGWDVSNVTSMRRMFEGDGNFNQDIGYWDVSNVTNMSSMFRGAFSFNKDISNWDVSSVNDMSGMFTGATSFNQDIGDWNVSNVTDMAHVFATTHSFNQDISGWDVSNVTDMRGMFTSSKAFNQNIGDWNVSSVTDISSMFSYTDNFNQDIGKWDVSNVTDMTGVFQAATSFNQNIGDWDVSNVTSFRRMIYEASSFNQDIGNWNFPTNINLIEFFNMSGMDCDHYSATLVGWQENNPNVTGVRLGAAGLEYGTSADAARDSLINIQGWKIEGDEESGMACDELVRSESPQVNDQNKLLIYPNPANDQIYLSVKNLPYTIINTQGKAVQNGRVEGQRIPIERLPTGIYYLKVNDDQKVYQARFVKE